MNLASISPGYSHVSIQRKRSNRVHVQLTESTDKQIKQDWCIQPICGWSCQKLSDRAMTDCRQPITRDRREKSRQSQRKPQQTHTPLTSQAEMSKPGGLLAKIRPTQNLCMDKNCRIEQPTSSALYWFVYSIIWLIWLWFDLPIRLFCSFWRKMWKKSTDPSRPDRVLLTGLAGTLHLLWP